MTTHWSERGHLAVLHMGPVHECPKCMGRMVKDARTAAEAEDSE